METDHRSRTFAELSRFVYRSPHWRNLLIPMAAIFIVDYLLIHSAFFVLVGIIGSFLGALLFDEIFVRVARFEFPFRRIMFLNFLCLAIWSVFFWILYAIGFASTENLVMIAFSAVGLVRVIILYGYYSDRSSKTIIPSLNYTYAGLIALYPVVHYPVALGAFFLSSLVYVAAGAIFVKRSTRKFKEEFEQSPTDMIKFFLNYKSIKESDSAGQKFFEKIYSHSRKVPVKVMDIMAGDNRKALLVFPYIHPGPFGRIGSSDLPKRLLERLPDIGADLLVFHTTTTNSNNCRGNEDIDAIAAAVKKALSTMTYSEEMSRFKKITVGKHVVSMQRFGDFALSAFVPEKEPFDDVSLQEGMKVMDALKNGSLSDIALVDAQNNFREGVRELKECTTFIPAMKRELSRMQPKFRAEIGYARKTAEMEGLAYMGIQVLVLKAGEQYQAIALTDSNNVTSSVIDMAREKCAGIVEGLEIYTTDNHVVNGGSLDMNPLGAKCDLDHLTDLIRDAVVDAKEDVSEVSVGLSSETVKVLMGDENTFQNLIDVVFSSIRTAKYTILAAIPISVLTSVGLFYLFMNFA